jgi:hypothetical protein
MDVRTESWQSCRIVFRRQLLHAVLMYLGLDAAILGSLI